MSLTKEEIQRYSRQIILKNMGPKGQEKLKTASVLLVGVGGLGSPAALYLAAAGVGRIGLIDFDLVDVTNLHRQVLYKTNQQGQSKVESARDNLLALNPLIQIECYNERLGIHNALNLFSQYDYILDGADNFTTRYLVNDASYFLKKPLISSSIMEFEGQLSLFNNENGPCYRCLYPEPPPPNSVQSCAEAGVLGVVPAVMGSLQANMVLNLILGLQKKTQHLLIYDAIEMQFTNLEIEKNADCILCGANARIKNLAEENFICSSVRSDGIENISPTDLEKRIQQKNIQLLDVRESFEREKSLIENSLHIPLTQVEYNWEQLSQETTLVIYCRSGGRSHEACKFLAGKGFKCINLDGGLIAWEQYLESCRK